MPNDDQKFHTALLPHKLDLNTDKGDAFTLWEQRWDDYAALSNLDARTPDSQMALLRACLSDDTLKVVLNLELPATDQKNPKKVIEALKGHSHGKLNVVIERRNFNMRRQLDGETFDQFLTDLRELVKTCAFCDTCRESLIRDRIVVGLRDGDIVEKLLAKPDLKLKDTIDICQAEESARRYRKEITGGSINGMSQYAKQKRGKYTESNAKSNNSQSGAGGKRVCWNCTKSHGATDHCPAKETHCAACGKRGHWAKARNCPKNSTQHQKTDGKKASMGSIIAAVSTAAAPKVRINVGGLVANGGEVIATPDTGADRSACGASTIEQLGIDPCNLRTPTIELKAADDHTIHQLGEFDAELTCNNRSTSDTIHVVEGTNGLYLSWYAAQNLGFLPSNYPEQQPAILAGLSVNKPDDILDGLNVQSVTRDELISKFKDTVFTEKVRVMPGEDFKVTLQDTDIQPFCAYAARPVAYAYRDKLEAKLSEMVSDGVIVPMPETSDWCAPIVVTGKKESPDIRMCVDLSKLNNYVKREYFPAPPPSEVVADIASSSARYFTKFDAKSGYYQIPLHSDSQHLTTFITPLGRFKFLRAPFGLSSISDHYNRRMAEALADIPRIRRITDDFIAYDDTWEQHVLHVIQILIRCAERGITLNVPKFVFGASETVFGGYILSHDGYRIHPDLTAAVKEFPLPGNRTDLRSFFGLANQLAHFTDEIAAKMEPLRHLLKEKNAFLWTVEHDQAFLATKAALASTPILAYYDPTRPTSLHCDASRLNGLGFVLKQQQPDKSWRMVQAGSRFITETESRYAMIELELLAAVWAVDKCRIYLEGLQKFEIVTDHRPLIPILNRHSLNEIENPRLQRLRMRLLMYQYHATWRSGKTHCAPDALSRSPIKDPEPGDQLAEDDLEAHVSAVIAAHREYDVRIDEVRQAAGLDATYTSLMETITNGFPVDKNQLDLDLRPYWGVRDQLSLDDTGLILYGCRLLIPTALRRDMLSRLHESHQGMERTKRRARLAIYWPRMDNDIEKMVRSCQECAEELPSQPKEPLQPHPEPTRIFEHMAADLFSYGGVQFLVITDIKSGWPTTYNLGRRVNSQDVIDALRKTFTDTAVPTTLYSDNGPQFKSRDTQRFLQQWGVNSVTSSPHYPQSNGHAEASVKAMKRLVKRCWDARTGNVNSDQWAKALLQWRNTPRDNGLSPAQVVFGHPARDSLPVHKRAFAPEWQRHVHEADIAIQQQKVERHYNASAHELPELQPGTPVAIQNHQSKRWNIYGTVIEVGNNRDYMIRLLSGRVWRRNRRYIRRRYPPDPPGDPPGNNPPRLQPLPQHPQRVPHAARRAPATGAR